MTAAATPVPRIPDYELVRPIGRGSYGDVWLARGVTGAYRAVKVVWRERFAELRPYEREFEGLSLFTAISLREPSQMALLHAGRNEAAGFFYYVMELADDAESGRTIAPASYRPLTLEVAARRGSLPAADVVACGVALARAVASLHAAGLVHRDIKPSNVIIVGGVPKLADVGLVTAASAGAVTFVGTEGFVPPEGPGAPAADVYSLGKVLYELATGLDRTQFPRLPPDLAGRADRRAFLELNEVLLRACEPDARRRFPDAQPLLDELLLLQAGKSVRRLRRAELRLTRSLRVAAALALVAAVAGAGAWVERRRANEEMARRTAAEAERDALAGRAVYAATLAQAQRALEQEDYGRARQLLNEARPAAGTPDRRGFEWHALWREAQGDPAQVWREAGPAIRSLAVAPNGRTLAVLETGLGATVFDPATGREVRRIAGPAGLLGISRDGLWLAGTNRELSLQRWQLADGQPAGEAQAPGINRPLGLLAGRDAVLFTDSPGQAPHVLRAWNLEQGREVWRHPVMGDGAGRPDFFRAAVSPDGRSIALVLLHGRGSAATWELRLVTAPDGVTLFREPTVPRITALAFSPDGRSLAVARDIARELALLDVEARQWRWSRPCGRSQVDTLAFSPDGRRVAVGGRDSRLAVFATDTGNLQGELRGQLAGVTALAWTDDRTLLSAGNGGDVRSWPAAATKAPREATGLWTPPGGGRRMAVSLDGRQVTATANGRDSRLLNPAQWDSASSLERVSAPLAYVDGGRLLALEEGRRLIRVDPGGDREVLAELPDGRTWVSPGISADLNRVALADVTGRLQVWDLTTRRCTADLAAHDGGAWWAAVAADGNIAATGGQDQQVRLWNLPDGGVRAAERTEAATMGAFDPLGRWLALTRRDGLLEIRATDDLRLLHRLRTSSSALIDVVVASAGDRLFCGGTNGNVHVIATDDWREIATLRWQPGGGLDSSVDRLALSRDGGTLAGYTNDGRVRVWRR